MKAILALYVCWLWLGIRTSHNPTYEEFKGILTHQEANAHRAGCVTWVLLGVFVIPWACWRLT